MPEASAGLLSPALVLSFPLLFGTALQVEPRHTELTFEGAQLLEIDRADDVDDRELARLGGQDDEAARLVAVHPHVDVHLLLIAPAADADQPRPARRRQLLPHRVEVRRRVAALSIELERP